MKEVFLSIPIDVKDSEEGYGEEDEEEDGDRVELRQPGVELRLHVSLQSRLFANVLRK